jgi:NAD(P)-dependent dehydrogenase (short-subunit alcohol dehydrogenase family)
MIIRPQAANHAWGQRKYNIQPRTESRRFRQPDLDPAQSVRRGEPGKARTLRRKHPNGRPGQPNEVAPAFLFLACEDASYMSGQVLHPNGGTVVNG